MSRSAIAAIVTLVAVALLAGTCCVPSPLGYFGLAIVEGSINRPYFDALKAEETQAKFVVDFVRLFPDSGVTYRFFDANPNPGYDAVAVILDRYELMMQLPVKFSFAGRRVSGYGEPKFYLHEAARVEDRGIFYDGSGQLIFGPVEWEKIVASGGNFEAIGYTMKKNQPVHGLKELLMEIKGGHR